MATPIQEALKIRKNLGRKFEVSDVVTQYAVLSQAAYAYLGEYGGDFGFLLEMQEEYEKEGKLTAGQVKGVLNCLAADRNYREDTSSSEGTPYVGDEVQRVIPNGTYTVTDGKEYTTIRVKDCGFGDLPEGTQVLEYLYGPNNEADFVGFAFLQGKVVKIWTKFKGSQKLKKAVDILLDPGVYKIAGERYSMQSKRCWRCGRKLTVPVSLHRGLGPECAGVVASSGNKIKIGGKGGE